MAGVEVRPLLESLTIERHVATITQSLLDGIDTQVRNAKSSSQGFGYCRFSSFGKTRKYIQRGLEYVPPLFNT